MHRAALVVGVAVLVVGLVVLASLFGGTYWTDTWGRGLQDKFFARVATVEPPTLRASFHPSLDERVDGPVLGAWMAAWNEHLGAYEGVVETHRIVKSDAADGVVTVESVCTVRFAGGEAYSRLCFIGGRLAEFEVRSEALPHPWFTELDDVTLYEERARGVLVALFEEDGEEAEDAEDAAPQAPSGPGSGALRAALEDARREWDPPEDDPLAPRMRVDRNALRRQFGEVLLDDRDAIRSTFDAKPPATLDLRCRLRTRRQVGGRVVTNEGRDVPYAVVMYTALGYRMVLVDVVLRSE